MNYGCIGEHLPHSFSKIIHEQIESYHYILKELAPDEVAPFMQKKDFSGINVTIPYKQTVIPFLDEIDDMAKAIGAVNTIVNRDGKLYGYNTDFAGLSALICRIGLSLSQKKVLIIGTGGTAKTAHAVAEAGGARAILHLSHSQKEGAIRYSEAYEQHSDAEIVINTSPCGMFPRLDTFPSDENGKPFDFDAFPSLEGAVDVVYNPLRTRFVLEAQKRGLPAQGGLYMLVAQAVFAANHFTGKEYPSDLIDKIFSSLVAEKENIVLIGMPGSGKSTLSGILAETLHCETVDTDSEIIKRIGMPIADYFAKYGEAAFRQTEEDVIHSLAGNTHTVIATGGGAILRRQNIDALKQNGRLYFLDRPLEDLVPTADRPLANSADTIRRRYEERYDIYNSAADVVIRDFESPETTAQEIAENHIKQLR